MSECRGNSLIYKGQVTDCAGLDNSLFFALESYYEVVRIIGGRPVFLDEHISRLEGSIIASSREMLMSGEKVLEAVNKLVELTSITDGNIKISFNYTGEQEYSLIYFVEALYPSAEYYEKGIEAILFTAERESPGIKLFNYHLRSQIYDKLVRSGAYEAFLVNSDGRITEGSKSNVFFIVKNTIVTAPDDKVLEGITRKYVLELCKQYKLKVEHRCLSIKELVDVDSVFITGTSPRVLPVRTLPGYNFDVKNKQLRYLMKAYNELIDKHLARSSR